MSVFHPLTTPTAPAPSRPTPSSSTAPPPSTPSSTSSATPTTKTSVFMLSVCYGLQLIVQRSGGVVKVGDKQEYERMEIEVERNSGIFGSKKVGDKQVVWMSHGDEVQNCRKMCDPEKENLSLYRYPSELWEVNLPAEEVPPELPKPTLGINFARDGVAEKDWLSLVAVHNDVWLVSVAFYFGARFGFDKADSIPCGFGLSRQLSL
ncbi:hypothetical protein ACFX13_026424 [Malus domestica]